MLSSQHHFVGVFSTHAAIVSHARRTSYISSTPLRHVSFEAHEKEVMLGRFALYQRLLSLSWIISLASFAHCQLLPERGWTLVQEGNTGISGLELVVVSPTLALILDKLEENPLQINGHPAWGALFNLETKESTPLEVATDSFCAGGTFLSNGTFVSIGGDGRNNLPEFPEFPNVNGTQGIRLFDPCDDPAGQGCTLFEDPKNLHIAATRWYPSVLRLPDGSAMITGGSAINNFYNILNNTASIEFFPPKDNGVPRPSPFLIRTEPANLFVLTWLLPNGKVLMVGNNQTMIYDVEANTETVLPELPNGVRVTYPFTGSGTLLGLSPPDYTPEVLICGGSHIDDRTPAINISSQTPASTQCNRMVITPEGIARGWQVEHMLESRIMPETIILPNGQVVIVNGGQTGTAAYLAVFDSPGSGNADHPAFTPSLYTPSAPLGSRFSNRFMPSSNIPRLYHSVATLTPSGNILIAGNNPNMDVNTTIAKFPTEFRTEFLNPPFMSRSRPTLSKVPSKIGFGKRFTVSVNIPGDLRANVIQLSLMDLGFATHGVHNTNRLVFMDAVLSRDRKSLTFTTPPNANIYPPGPAFVFLTIDGVSSIGTKVMVGSGANPPIAA